MILHLKLAVILLALMCACNGCAPKEMFSCIDRNCFVADWTNHYSCLSCCRRGNCQHARPMVQHEMLVLGNQPTTISESETFSQPAEAGADLR